MSKYYYLVSGLPEIQLDDSKLQISISELKEHLKEELSDWDYRLVRQFFMKTDNQNILLLLENQEAELLSTGNLNREDILELITEIKEKGRSRLKGYEYLWNFIPAYLEEQPIFPALSWEDQLNSVFYDHAINLSNSFISEWFEYNLNITNIQIGIQCRKHHLDPQQNIIGNNEIAEQIKTSNARDFGLGPVFHQVDEVMRLTEEPNFYEREKKTDLLRWQWLEEEGFFHYFDIERILIYLIRLEIMERWVVMEKEVGDRLFREMINGLKNAFEFPAEFKLKKIK